MIKDKRNNKCKTLRPSNKPITKWRKITNKKIKN